LARFSSSHLLKEGPNAFKMAYEAEVQQTDNVGLYVIVGVYLGLLTLIAKLAHSRKRKEIAEKGQVRAHFSGSYGSFVLMLTTFSTVYSGFTVTGIPDEAFAKGFVSLRWIGATLVIVAGMLLLYPRLRRLAVERSYTSPFDFVSDRFGTKRLRILCAICGVTPMIIYITAQMISFAAMVEGMTMQVIPKWASMIMFGLMILTLEMLGGMNSVVFTDVVQSIVMIASFLVVPFVLGAQYGFLPEMAPADCSHLVYVSPDVPNPYAVPDPCEGPNCVAAGCIKAVKPEFYDFPSRSTCCDIWFFLINMLAAPVQPHMLQRAYIAKSDFDLRFVIAAMLVAPFIAQPPGIVIGITKAVNDPAWPEIERTATAFSGLTAQLKLMGPFQYILVSVMTCSALAAIMSTADSALMGVSSVVSIDVLQGTLIPSLSNENVVRAGAVSSVCTCLIAFFLGTFLSSDQMGAIIVFQNGMLMQLLPAFGIGLYTRISERAVSTGIIVGLLSLLILVIFGNPLDGYVPVINLSAFLNFVTSGFVQAFIPGSPQKQLLDVSNIRDIMTTSREPNLVLIFLMFGIALVSAPWYSTPGEPEQMLWGVPRWGCIQVCAFIVVFLIGALCAAMWKPPRESTELKQDSQPCETEKESIQGIAAQPSVTHPEAATKC